MKRLTIFIMSLGIAFAMLISCDKNENVKNSQTDPFCASNYVFINPNWVLVEENFVDENGNVGNLFINTKNTIESKLLITNSSKDSQGTTYTGTYEKLYNSNHICIGHKCAGEPLDCGTIVSTDSKGNIINVRIIIKE